MEGLIKKNMAQYTTVKNGIKYRLFGGFIKMSGNGNPMILIELQIVNKGTKGIKVVPFDMWTKVVSIFKDKIDLIKEHSDFVNILKTDIKGLN